MGSCPSTLFTDAEACIEAAVPVAGTDNAGTAAITVISAATTHLPPEAPVETATALSARASIDDCAGVETCAIAAATPIEIRQGGVETLYSKFTHGKIGDVTKVSIAVLSAAPIPLNIGSALSAVLTLMKERADGAVTNTENCKKLLETVQWTRKVLLEAGGEEEARANAAEEWRALTAAMEYATDFLGKFSKSNFMGRLVHAGRDKDDFARHNDEVTQCTQRLTLVLAVGRRLSPPPAVTYDDGGSPALRAELCRLGGSEDVQEAMAVVAADPELLRQLKQHMGLEAQIQTLFLEAGLAALAEKARHVKLPDKLPHELRRFWYEHFNAESTGFDIFFDAVLSTIKDKVYVMASTVKERATKLLHLAASEVLGGPGCWEQPERLIKQLLQGHVDLNGNGLVHTDEYYHFYSRCHDWAASAGVPEPDSFPSCVNLLCAHFDPKILSAVERKELHDLAAVLKPFNFSSDMANHLTRFLPGSRSWLFQTYEEWLAKGPTLPERLLVEMVLKRLRLIELS